MLLIPVLFIGFSVCGFYLILIVDRRDLVTFVGSLLVRISAYVVLAHLSSSVVLYVLMHSVVCTTSI